MTRALALSLSLLALAGTSHATTLYGNPSPRIELLSGSAVQIGQVLAYTCPGNHAEPVNDTLTASGFLEVTLPEDTWCDLVIQVQWAGTSTWDAVPVDGFTDFVTDEAYGQRTIVLDPTDKSATLE